MFDLERVSYRDNFRNHVLRHILPFWASYSIDKTYGGYITLVAPFMITLQKGLPCREEWYMGFPWGAAWARRI